MITKSFIYRRFAILIFFLIPLTSCRVQLVADYDETAAESIINAYQKIELFYLNLMSVYEEERVFETFKENYLSVETELNILVIRNKIRPFNEESTRIAEIILEKWIKYKNSHKDKNSYKDVLIDQHRKRFYKLFTALAVAEEAKKIASDDN